MTGAEDNAYAAELLAILTNKHPPGIKPDDPYGLADDRIDRYNGFGADVWVTSVETVQDGPWDELEIGFERSIDPRVGTVRVVFDREWRELSLYDTPGAYAPMVARAVESAARRLGAPVAIPAPAPDREAWWAKLLNGLGAFGTVEEVAPGRLEVADADDPAEVLTVLVTPDEWGLVPSFEDVDLYLADAIGPRHEDESFVVFHHGGLVRSVREKLPPVRGTLWLRELAEQRAKNPDAPFGWFAYRPLGGASSQDRTSPG